MVSRCIELKDISLFVLCINLFPIKDDHEVGSSTYDPRKMPLSKCLFKPIINLVGFFIAMKIILAFTQTMLYFYTIIVGDDRRYWAEMPKRTNPCKYLLLLV